MTGRKWSTNSARSASGAQTEANLYTADGSRLIRRTPGSVTAYLPNGQELTLETAGQTLTGTRYYSFAGRTIAVRTGTGGAGVTTLVPDSQGSALESIGDTTHVATRRWTDAFGANRGTPTGAWTGQHGFLDKVTDPTGLTQVGARYYEPNAGRFISVDPIMSLSDPQQWSAYAYAGNNPATCADPSGQLVTHDGDSYTAPLAAPQSAANRLTAIGASATTPPAPESFSQRLSKITNSQLFKLATAPQRASANLLIGAVKSIPQMNSAAVAQRLVHDYNDNGGGWWGAYNAAVLSFDPMYAAVSAGYDAHDQLAQGNYGDAAVSASTAAQITGLTALAVDGCIPSGASSAAGVGASGAEGGVQLFRNVDATEFDSIAATGKFTTGEGMMEGKWFATTGEHAEQWGAVLNGGRGLTVETWVPRSVADQLHFEGGKLDGIGPARYADGSQLDLINDSMNGIRVWP